MSLNLRTIWFYLILRWNTSILFFILTGSHFPKKNPQWHSNKHPSAEKSLHI